MSKSIKSILGLHPSNPYLGTGADGAINAAFVRSRRQETLMSKSIKSILAIGLVAFVAACAQQQQAEEEFVVVEPVSQEPVYTGKYK